MEGRRRKVSESSEEEGRRRDRIDRPTERTECWRLWSRVGAMACLRSLDQAGEGKGGRGGHAVAEQVRREEEETLVAETTCLSRLSPSRTRTSRQPPRLHSSLPASSFIPRSPHQSSIWRLGVAASLFDEETSPAEPEERLLAKA